MLLASEVVRGKTPKTFQNLSFPFIASQVGENGVRGDPKNSAHCMVNSILDVKTRLDCCQRQGRRRIHSCSCR